MSVNLLETIQQNLGYPQLQKIDPNTQQEENNKNQPAENKFSQAAIPAVLTGFYKYVQTDKGADEILQADNSFNWIDKIFDIDKNSVIQRVSDYGDKLYEEVEKEMNVIADETVKSVKENLVDDAGIKEVKIFFSHQKNNILLHLPPVLNMGVLLHDNTLDDNTNKMEGPISSLIQNIGAIFSSPVTSEETKDK